MATMLRQPGSIYNVTYDKVPLELVANSERDIPRRPGLLQTRSM